MDTKKTKNKRVVVGITGSDLLGISTVDTDDKFINNANIILLLLCPNYTWVIPLGQSFAFLHNCKHPDRKVLTVNRLFFLINPILIN